MENINIIKRVRKFVEEKCRKPSNKFGYEIYEEHFVPMVKNSKILAEKLGADIEVVEIAAWLHDIGSIIYERRDFKNYNKCSKRIRHTYKN